MLARLLQQLTKKTTTASNTGDPKKTDTGKFPDYLPLTVDKEPHYDPFVVY